MPRPAKRDAAVANVDAPPVKKTGKSVVAEPSNTNIEVGGSERPRRSCRASGALQPQIAAKPLSEDAPASKIGSQNCNVFDCTDAALSNIKKEILKRELASDDEPLGLDFNAVSASAAATSATTPKTKGRAAVDEYCPVCATTHV
jgi:hypothetical protein